MQVRKEETADKTYYVAITFLGYYNQAVSWQVLVGNNEDTTLSKWYLNSHSFSFRAIDNVIQIIEEDSNNEINVSHFDLSRRLPAEMRSILPNSINLLLRQAEALNGDGSKKIVYNNSIVIAAPKFGYEGIPRNIEVLIGNPQTNTFTTAPAQLFRSLPVLHYKVTCGLQEHILTLLPPFGTAQITSDDITWNNDVLCEYAKHAI